MTSTSLGGASSAVAASAHAACARFRGTDPLVVGRSRRKLAADVGFADDSGRIPEARWMRAMTFERLVRSPKFASEVATTTVGRLGLARPAEVVTVTAHVSVDTTAALLAAAHTRATANGAATLVHGLAVPFVGFEESPATDVKPDFAVVAPKVGVEGESWLIVGDSKDYERVRSRIEDTRLLKGFLQVALGAESAESWSRLPKGMSVHSYGVLAAPRNAFLQPEALVELLDDHRAEVRMRVAERRREAEQRSYDETKGIEAFVAHLGATFDPATCTTCTLFSYCRHELRISTDPADLMVELGVPADLRPRLVGLVDGTGEIGTAPASAVANVAATLDGVGRNTGQCRTDQAGQAGTVNVVVVKSDAAALGVHGIALQRVTAQGRLAWQITVFDDPQSERTRRSVMHLLGRELIKAMSEQRKAGGNAPSPIHLAVPDRATADILASIADNLAGIELSRLRWERDRAMGREPLTFNGEPAQIPTQLPEADRTAVSFLLEEDRARALTLRSPIVDVRDVLARHVVAGGPAVASQRLDYLVTWGESGPVDPRLFEDEIESSEHTPGARLTNRRSDAIHQALAGSGSRRRGAGGGPADPERYAALVTEELQYKAGVLERALDVLDGVPDSALRVVHRAIEGDAQAVWRRRLTLHASDLVRFGRTYRHWRNSLVPVIESDGKCHSQLLALANPQVALDLATDAGVREIAVATVVDTGPLVLDVESRRIGDGSRIVLLHRNDDVCVEQPGVGMTAQAGSFKFVGLSIGPLTSAGDADAPRRVRWAPTTVPRLVVGDRLVVADFAWFSSNMRNTALNVARPKADSVSAPKATCGFESYAADPSAHRYCCRPHEDAEAEWSDQLADRRANGQLNPEVWPPVVDGDAFEVGAAGAPVGDAASGPPTTPPEGLTMDDLE
ncbi:MAG: hypothetical protein AB7V44_01575 [Pseudonocardia sp.]